MPVGQNPLKNSFEDNGKLPQTSESGAVAIFGDRPTIAGNDVTNNNPSNIRVWGIIVRGNSPGLIQKNQVRSNGRGIQAESNASGGAAGDQAIQVLDNTVTGNSLRGIFADGSVLVAGNTVSGHRDSDSVGIELTGGSHAVDNTVSDNTTGISGARDTLAAGNSVKLNDVGIRGYVESNIQGNQVFQNITGILGTRAGVGGTSAYFAGTIRGNVLYDNADQAIYIRYSGLNTNPNAGTVIENNTVVQPVGTAVRIEDESQNVTLRNNILSVGEGTIYSVAGDSQRRFTTDYNLLDWDNTLATLAQWNSMPITSYEQWYFDVKQDRQSIVAGPQFATTAEDTPPYTLLAPSSPAIDRGDPTADFANEPAPNGGRVNIGAYGNTANAATSSAVTVQLLSPHGLEKYEQGQVVSVRWQSVGTDPGATLTLQLLDESTGGVTALLADNAPVNDTEFQWTVPASLTAEHNYRLQVTLNDDPSVRDASSLPFQIANDGASYYVNTTTDAEFHPSEYTTAAGDYRHSGKTPDHPLPSLQSVISNYDLDPGDTIYLDTGTYITQVPYVLEAQDSGVTILGAAYVEGEQEYRVLLDRANNNPASISFDFTGADDVTIDNVDIAHGYQGLVLEKDSESNDFTLQHSQIYDHLSAGVWIGQNNANSAILQNVFEQNATRPFTNTGTTITGAVDSQGSHTLVENNQFLNNVSSNANASNAVYLQGIDDFQVTDNEMTGNGRGIRVDGGFSLVADETGIITNNTLTANVAGGILVSRVPTLIEGNVIHGHVGNNVVGVDVRSSASIVRDNRVWKNEVGIALGNDDAASSNAVFANTTGVQVEGSGFVGQNAIYSNSTGVAAASFRGTIANNLVYANTNTAILINSSQINGELQPTVVNNTVRQVVGDALRLQTNARDLLVRNNIFYVDEGADVFVANTTSLDSDYNLFFQSDEPDAHVGIVGSTIHDDLGAWQAATGLDLHSQEADPDFVDIDGADNVLGWLETETYDGGADDNFSPYKFSPAIDAAEEAAAPATDYYGYGRTDDPAVANTGVPTSAFVDIGAIEFRTTSEDAVSPSIESIDPPEFVRGEGVPHAIDRIVVCFSEPVLPADSEAPRNYIVQDQYGTEYDFVVQYDEVSHCATLRRDALDPLPPNNYRLSISGTNTIHDLAGNRLDGDGDGEEGGDFIGQISAGFIVQALTPLETTEQGGAVAIEVRLDAPPAQEVTVDVASSDVNEGDVAVLQLHFTPDNWDIPQLVVVVGVDDALADGDHEYDVVIGPSQSDDLSFDGLLPVHLTVMNLDDETHLLEPRLAAWNGDAAVGLPGDGVNWNDSANWTVGQVPDVDPASGVPGDHVVFLPESTIRAVTLNGPHSVSSLSFEDSYSLDGATLVITEGRIHVTENVHATLDNDLESPVTLVKQGTGTLTINGVVPDLTVESGILSGNATADAVEIRDSAQLRPGSDLGTFSVASLDVHPGGSLVLELTGSNAGEFDRLIATGNVDLAGNLMLDVSEQLVNSLVAGTPLEFLVVTSSQLVWNGQFDAGTLPAGVFAEVQASDGALRVVIQRYLAGDANRDGSVDVRDFNRWNANKFKAGTTWETGDYNGDAVTDGADFNLWFTHRFQSVDTAPAATPRTPRAPLAENVDRVFARDPERRHSIYDDNPTDRGDEWHRPIVNRARLVDVVLTRVLRGFGRNRDSA
ncbi:MAG: right-handed parallel beta-helix repeat-containing protein [Planctomycetales bacterium]|nr:right-handed parallel beta-helix repeat-containing protein [Planctomycetales bacterium]